MVMACCCACVCFTRRRKEKYEASDFQEDSAACAVETNNSDMNDLLEAGEVVTVSMMETKNSMGNGEQDILRDAGIVALNKNDMNALKDDGVKGTIVGNKCDMTDIQEDSAAGTFVTGQVQNF